MGVTGLKAPTMLAVGTGLAGGVPTGVKGLKETGLPPASACMLDSTGAPSMESVAEGRCKATAAAGSGVDASLVLEAVPSKRARLAASAAPCWRSKASSIATTSASADV